MSSPNDEAQPRQPKTRRAITCYSLRIEYAGNALRAFPVELSNLLPGWYRDFEISGKTTLEQLSSAILQILDWDQDHLYEFRMGERVHVFFGEDELFADAAEPCVSCEIPMDLLGLAPSHTFFYIFDFGDYHTFRVTVLDVRTLPDAKKLPALLAHKGKNIIQYPSMMSNKEAQAFERKPPTLDALEPRKDKWRIRFIRSSDRKTLTEWPCCLVETPPRAH